jgi:23S rRNA pseudouridine2604 synthase
MNIKLQGLEPGKWRYFTKQEMEEINRMLVHSSKTGDPSGYEENMDE